MKKEEVTVQYIHPVLLSRLGARPVKMSLFLAKTYKDKGFVKILNESPQTNVIPEELKNESQDGSVSFVRKEVITNVAWITTKYVDKTIRDVGKLCGFDVTIVSKEVFSLGVILKSDILIVSPTVFDFDINKLSQIKSILFQQRKPYILFIDKQYDFSLPFKHLVLRSGLNIFSDEGQIDIVCEDLGEAMTQDWFTYSRDKVYDLWKTIEEIQ